MRSSDRTSDEAEQESPDQWKSIDVAARQSRCTVHGLSRGSARLPQVATEMSLPEPIGGHDNPLGLLARRPVRRVEDASEEGRNSEPG